MGVVNQPVGDPAGDRRIADLLLPARDRQLGNQDKGPCLIALRRIDVLMVDDWAMARLTENERRAFWEICEDRRAGKAT